MNEFSVAPPWFMCSVTGYNPFRNSCLLLGQADFVGCNIRNPNSCRVDISSGYCFNSNSTKKVMNWTQTLSVEYVSCAFDTGSRFTDHLIDCVVNGYPRSILRDMRFIEINVLLTCSTETTIKSLLMKMTVHVVHSFYYAFQTLMYEIEAYLSTSCMEEEDEEDADYLSRKDPRIKRPGLRKHTTHSETNKSSVNDDDDDDNSGSTYSTLNQKKVEAETFEAIAADHGSGSVLSIGRQWPVYDTIYRPDGSSYLKLQDEKVGTTSTMVPFIVVNLNRKNLQWANQFKVEISSTFLKGLLPGEMDRFKCKKIVTVDGPELFRSYENLREQRESYAAKFSEPSSSAAASINKEELQHIAHLVRFMDQEFEVIKSMYAAMENERCVTWEMLWAFLPPGEMVIYLDEVTDECVW